MVVRWYNLTLSWCNLKNVFAQLILMWCVTKAEITCKAKLIILKTTIFVFIILHCLGQWCYFEGNRYSTHCFLFKWKNFYTCFSFRRIIWFIAALEFFQWKWGHMSFMPDQRPHVNFRAFLWLNLNFKLFFSVCLTSVSFTLCSMNYLVGFWCAYKIPS